MCRVCVHAKVWPQSKSNVHVPYMYSEYNVPGTLIYEHGTVQLYHVQVYSIHTPHSKGQHDHNSTSIPYSTCSNSGIAMMAKMVMRVYTRNLHIQFYEVQYCMDTSMNNKTQDRRLAQLLEVVFLGISE